MSLLVVIAVYANCWSFHRVAEIRREKAFHEQMVRSVNELIRAAEQVAAKKHGV